MTSEQATPIVSQNLDLLEFIRAGGITLRRYQEKVARAIVDAALNRRGLSFAVMFPRQSGKNEMQAQIEAYLLWALSDQDAEIVKVAPTWRPQAMNAMRRLERVLDRNPHTTKEWVKESGFILRLGRARISFLSGAPGSNIVGATASILLEVDEAQGVRQEKFDRDILPMAASTNATRVFWGTAWNGKTLLSREMQAAREAEARLIAGAQAPAAPIQLAFRMDADDVAKEVPAYRVFVDEQVARHGRDHPLIRTQYFSEEVDGSAGMFSPEQMALMRGSHPPQDGPIPGKIYALLLDVGGEGAGQVGLDAKQLSLFEMGAEEAQSQANPARDATALTVVEVDRSTCSDPLIRAPTYRVVQRGVWRGREHNGLYSELTGWMRHWNGQRLVVDATGLGTGVASFLQKAFGEKVIPFTFTTASKSNLAWAFLDVVKAGRWQEPHFPEPAPQKAAPQMAARQEAAQKQSRKDGQGKRRREKPVKEQSDAGEQKNWKNQVMWQKEFFREVSHCQLSLLTGPEKHCRWGVPDGTRDAHTGEYVHDDLVISAALCVQLENVAWAAPSSGAVCMVINKHMEDRNTGF